jgi:hypothetical protein
MLGGVNAAIATLNPKDAAIAAARDRTHVHDLDARQGRQSLR